MLELVDGWDLGRVLHRAAASGVRVPRELSLHITAEVCRALAYAHAKTDGQRPLGIVHRDVSPHNVLLSEQGEVKLTDFGIAKAMNKREHTGVGVVKGKVAFMSPEQAHGKTIDARSDLFSLGTVLYLLVTRTRPFEGPSELETLLRVQKGDFRPPDVAAPDLHPEVAALVARAMQPDPNLRYQTADEMLADVERVLRTVFHPVGQSELKKWLADLSARDGVPPISRAAARTHAAGGSELDEQDVVLLDTDADVVDAQEPTSLAVVNGGGAGSLTSRPRVSRTSRHHPGPARSRRRRDDVPAGPPGRVGAARPRRRASRPAAASRRQRRVDPLHRRAAGGRRLVRRQVRARAAAPGRLRTDRNRRVHGRAARRAHTFADRGRPACAARVGQGRRKRPRAGGRQGQGRRKAGREAGE